MSKVSRKIAIQLAERSLARTMREQPDRVGAIARMQAHLDDLRATKGRWA